MAKSKSRGRGTWIWIIAALVLAGGCVEFRGADPEQDAPGEGGGGGGGAGGGATGGGAGGDATGGGGAGGDATGGGGAGGAGAGEAAAPRSCGSRELGTELLCGPEEISCCDSRLVPGGTFDRNFAGAREADGAYPATVSGFLLDTFEVTVGRFRAFVDAGGGTQASAPEAGAGEHSKIPGSGWSADWKGWLEEDTAALKAALHCDPPRSTWTDDAGPNENLPMNCVTWPEAFAFCAWDGGRLPTDAELNYAAAGGDEQRSYPWGEGIDLSRASYGCLGDADAAPACSLDDFSPVGSKPMGAGRWGHQDLAGGVSEFVRDSSDPLQIPCVDCARLDPSSMGNYVVVRGGSALDSEASLYTTSRGVYRIPGRYDPGMGVRCARNPPSAE
ncbi:putative membrane protein [Sorangium cellulosum So ce56]|uniref:Membrane protein n=1 Tax=Sorangium cellulosum (strain So ce56) TaxID=448385 RepID=A9FAZ5_SORC5|nr:SUMF1/EgtB/PvdO family nonheme iron enzyme [Sorangium cellulosum]CAN97959.1 putative membrane protein [Sorangium cellulosum So ce56]